MYKKPIYLIFFGFVLSLAFSSISGGSEPNLVGWWKFDEPSGTTAYNSATYTNGSWPAGSLDGTLNGNPQWVAGYRDGAIQLDPSNGDDYVSFPTNNFGDLINELPECTFSIWVYWNGGGGWQRFIDIGTGQNNYIYICPQTGAADASMRIAIVTSVGGTFWDEFNSSQGALPTGGWHHVAATISKANTTMILYLDGKVVGSKTNLESTNSIDQLGVTTNNWLGDSQYADPYFDGYLDDFKIFNRVLTQPEIEKVADPEKASMPYPEDEVTIGQVSLDLEWEAGIYAASTNGHNVYFGDNFDDVNEGIGDANKGLQTATSYPVSDLTPGETYYWRIDEVNDANVWKGRVWSFLVQPLKAYNPSPPNDANFVDPNADLTWVAGVNAVTHDIHFGKTYPPSFIKNQSGTSYDPGTMDFNTTYYWRIDEVNGTDVEIGNDWHFKVGPVQIEDPHLVGWWKLDDGTGTRAIDWSGYYRHGTLYNGGEWVEDGKFDGALQFDGIDDYVSLPVGDVISTLDECTIATWVDFNDGTIWQRIFNFGTSTSNYMYLSPEEGTGVMYAAIMSDGGTESTMSSYDSLPTGWHHLAMVLETDNWVLYLDSQEFGIEFSPLWVPSDLGVTTHNWLGRSEWPNDPYFNGYMDDFRIYDYAMTQEQVKDIVTPLEAWLPEPDNDATGVFRYPTLSWEPGKYAADVNGHELYYGTNLEDVENRVGDPVVLTDPCYTIPGPNAPYESLEVVYWVVDEINDSHPDLIWPGDIWSFTIRDASLIDDLDGYSDTGKSTPPPAGTLKSVWVDGHYAARTFPTVVPGTSGSLVQLNTDTKDGDPTYPHYTPDDNDIAQSGAQSMKFYYDNDGYVCWERDLYGFDFCYEPDPDIYLSEAYAAVDDAAQTDPELDSLDMLRDWSIYNVLGLSFYGDPNNTTNNAGLYIGLEDVNGILVTIAHPDPTLLTEPWWHGWYVKLSDFTNNNPNLYLSEIVKIYIGFGNKDDQQPGGSGVVFFDDIQLFTGVCIPGSVIGDFNNDCTVTNSDLEIFTYSFPGETPVLPNPIIYLSAADLPLGPLSSWANEIDDSGVFVDVNLLDPNIPVVETIAGKKCVTFDTTDMLIWDQTAPSTITGDSDYTVIYEVYNPTIADEEWLLTWAQRGGPANTCAGVGYGTNEAWAAVVHWNVDDQVPDMGFDRGVPVAKQWHVIGVTYDGTTEALAVDGAIQNIEDKDLDIYADQPVTLGAGYEEPADANDAYETLNNKYVPTYDLRFDGSVASIKVYGEAIPPGDLSILTASLAGLSNAETDIYTVPNGDGKIDFKDFAVMGTKWMEDPYLFGEDY